MVEALEELVSERVRAELAGQSGSDASPWLPLRGAAAYVGVSERTLERAIASGRLRSATIGRRRLVHRDDLDVYVRGAAGEETAPTAPPRRRTG